MDDSEKQQYFETANEVAIDSITEGKGSTCSSWSEARKMLETMVSSIIFLFLCLTINIIGIHVCSVNGEIVSRI